MTKSLKCPDCGHINIAGADEWCESCHSPLTQVEQAPKKGMERRILQGALSDLSPKKALKVLPEDCLRAALEKMRGAKVGCVLVVDSAGDLSGVLSERELLLRVSETADLDQPVKSFMRTDTVCLKETDEVALAFNRMALSGNRHVPLRMNDGSYGVVSVRDLLRFLCK